MLVANVLLSVSAFAQQVAYEYSGLSWESDDPQWEISGSFVFNEAELVENLPIRPYLH